MSDYEISVSAEINKIIEKYGIGELREIRRIVRDVMHKVNADSMDEDLASVAQERHLQLVYLNPGASDELLNQALKALADAVVSAQQRWKIYQLVRGMASRTPVSIVDGPADQPSGKPYKSRSQHRREVLEGLRAKVASLEEQLFVMNNLPKEMAALTHRMEILKGRSENAVERFKMYVDGNIGTAPHAWKGLELSMKSLDICLEDFRPKFVQSSLCREEPLPAGSGLTTKCVLAFPEDKHIHQRSVTPEMIDGAVVGEGEDHSTLWLKIPGYKAVCLGNTPQTMCVDESRSWKAKIALLFNGAGKISEKLVFQEKRSVSHLCGINRHKVFTLRYEFTKATANEIISRITGNN